MFGKIKPQGHGTHQKVLILHQFFGAADKFNYLRYSKSQVGIVRVSTCLLDYLLFSIFTFLSTVAPSILKDCFSGGRGKQLKNKK